MEVSSKMGEARTILQTTAAVLLAAVTLAVSPAYVCGQDSRSDSGMADWALTPDLRIGNDGELDLTRVRILLPADDGSLRFLDANELIVLGPSGRIRSRSQRGEGPGEFILPIQLGWWMGRDSIWVQDAALRRFTVLTADGEYVRSFRQEELSYGSAFRVVVVRNFLPDGSRLALTEQYGPEPPDSFPLVRIQGNGTIEEILRVSYYGNSARLYSENGGFFMHPLPSGPLFAFEPGGERTFLVDRPAYDGGGTPRARIQARSPSGTVLWTRDIAYDPVPVPDQELDSLSASLRQRFEDMFGGRSRREVARIFDRSVQLPSHYPPIRSAFSETGGRLWLQWADGRGDSQFTVLDSDGSIMARVAGPENDDGAPRAVAGNFAWGVIKGPFDVPIIIRWVIDRRAAPSIRSAPCDSTAWLRTRDRARRLCSRSHNRWHALRPRSAVYRAPDRQ